MNAHIGTRQTRFLIGIFCIGLLSFGASPYGSSADRDVGPAPDRVQPAEPMRECTFLAPNAPLAEDGGYGTCSVDGDCPGLSVCRDNLCYAPKNRYISFQPNNSGTTVAFRIDLTSCDTFPGCTFTKKWVGEPDGDTAIARVEDTAVYRDWTEPVIHVGDLEIVPASTYTIQAIEQGSDPGDPASYSAAVTLPTVPMPTSCEGAGTCYWADIAGMQVPPGVFPPPEGDLNFNDIVAMIRAFQEHSSAPPLTWMDIARVVPNGVIDGRDLLAIVEAYRGDPYPGPSPCGVRGHVARDPSTTLRAECPPECPLPDPTTPVATCMLVDPETGEELLGDQNGKRTTVAGKSVLVQVLLKDMNCVQAYQTELTILPEESGVEVNCPEDAQQSCHEDGVSVWAGRDDFVFEEGQGVGDSYPSCSCLTRRAFVRTDTHYSCAELEPPSYLATYMLRIDPEAAGQEFEILIHAEEPQGANSRDTGRTGMFLVDGESNSFSNTTAFEPDPVSCGTLKVAYDCNENGVADDCDINCNSDGLGSPCVTYDNCETSLDCNDNEYPDECEIVPAQCPADPGGPYYCCPECIGCPEDPAHCICSTTQEDCPEGCDCVTGEGCPEGCEPQCVVAVSCDPDCQPDGEPGHGIPDACDITSAAGDPDLSDCNENCIPDRCDILGGTGGDNGLCDSQERDCSWDCQPNQIPDECEADCSNDGCPDDCEYLTEIERPGQSCGQPVAEEDCDSDGMCNVDEISEANNGACTGEDCSSDCHVYCYDPEVYKPWCDPYVGIPDECDIRDCPGCDPEDPDCYEEDCSDCDGNGVPDWCDINVGCDRTCCRDCQPETDPRHGIPDGCDIRDCDGDVACQDWNYNDVPDACDIPQDELNHPGWYFCTAVPDQCPSCDANENRIPDERECPGASQSGACENAFDDEGMDTPSVQAAFRIERLNGSPGEFSGLSGSATIERGTPHFHDDDPEDKGDDQPCLVPPGFPEPQPTDFTRSREVHLEITSLQVGTCPAGPCVRHRAAKESIGETQGTCLDFPADTFFAWYIQATMGELELHNETPIVLRGELPDFGWTFANPRSVFANDHTRPAIPLFEDNGVQRAYLATTRLGQGQFTEGTDESCRVYRGVDGRVSFAVDGQTYGVLIPNCETNHVKEDKDAVSARQRVTVYNAMGDPPPPADFTGTWENSNAMVPALTGDMEAVDDPFHVGDAINSMSFGRDGTGNTTSPILYFSVDVDSTGRECTDVSRQVLAYQDDRQRVAADVYMAAGKAFGSYDSPLVPPCTTEHGNCLVADQTALGLGPLVKGKDLAGQVDRGLKDNIIALETSTFPGDWAYFTFIALDAPLNQTKTTIYVYNPANGSFRRAALAPFVNLGPTEDGGLGILKSGDTVDAIAVSDVAGGQQEPDGVWNTGDEVLFSLAPGSQTLTYHGWSGAHIFKVTHGQSDPITVANVFLGPAALGLMGGTDDPDDIDGIDVGAAKTFDDCNHNGIDDLCDIARGFSANDIDPPANIPDECETACSVTSEAPEPERLPLLGDPISQKVRYISFNPTDTGQRQAIRVTFEDLPAPFNVFNGEVMWIDEPTTYCENGGVKKPPCPPAQPSDDFLGAMLQCQPYFTDWHGVCRCGWCIGGFNDGQTCSEDSDCAHTIHVYDQLIVPYGVYRIDVIDQRCTDLSNELSYSEPMVKDDLETTTSKWGDLIRDCTTCPYWPPDGVINMATDVTAVLDKFRNLEPPDVNCAPVTKARADIEPDIPDQLVNISDATCVLDAFRGFDYPFTAPDLPLCDDGASD